MRLFACLLLAATLVIPQSIFTRRAPGFALPDQNQRIHDLQDYRGRVVLIEFLQTGCPKCLELTATLKEIERKYSGRVVILAVVLPPDNMDTVARFRKEHGVTWPVLFDCGQMTASYLRLTPDNPTVHFPHLIVVDPRGIIQADLHYDSEAGKMQLGPLSQLIDGLLKGQKPPVQ